MERQFDGRCASQGTSHQKEVSLPPSSLENLLKPLEDFMGISNHARPGRMASAHAISAIVGHKKVDLPLVVLGGNEIVIAGNLAVAVEVEDLPGISMYSIEIF